ncbi:MAG TPA: AraC family transcriptional regulator [Bryobacteraceae bacterium]|nr:AraC family transcriptional regulator [Bryobacteraceae bacterium]
MSGDLRAGQYFGAISRKTDCAGAILSQVVHTSGRKLPRHQHQLGYLSLLLAGTYVEQCGRQTLEYSPFNVGCHPAALDHRDEIGSGGAHFFCIEFREDLIRSARDFGSPEMSSPCLGDPHAAALAARLFCAHWRSSLSDLPAEALVYELLGCYMRARVPNEARPPAWLRQAIELVRAESSRPLRFAEIARRVGVHPVHLARVYRKLHRESLGDLLQRIRIQHAMRLLHGEFASMAHVGVAAGFADQSHFIRVFRSHTGTTPGAFRRMLTT